MPQMTGRKKGGAGGGGGSGPGGGGRGNKQAALLVPNLFWFAITEEELREYEGFVGLPEVHPTKFGALVETAPGVYEERARFDGPFAAVILGMRNHSWYAKPFLVCETILGSMKNVLGFNEPFAAAILGMRNQADHFAWVAACNRLREPEVDLGTASANMRALSGVGASCADEDMGAPSANKEGEAMLDVGPCCLDQNCAAVASFYLQSTKRSIPQVTTATAVSAALECPIGESPSQALG
eukprot:gene5572-4206_t